MRAKAGGFYQFDPGALTATFTAVGQKHYPHRVPPKQWPSKELIGKAMARGWAVPCRYYPRIRGRGGYYRTFIHPGISDAETKAIHAVMRSRLWK